MKWNNPRPRSWLQTRSRFLSYWKEARSPGSKSFQGVNFRCKIWFAILHFSQTLKCHESTPLCLFEIIFLNTEHLVSSATFCRIGYICRNFHRGHQCWLLSWKVNSIKFPSFYEKIIFLENLHCLIAIISYRISLMLNFPEKCLTMIQEISKKLFLPIKIMKDYTAEKT